MSDHLYLCILANVAQLVEQLIRNEQVTGSSPVIGSPAPRVTSRHSGVVVLEL